MKRFLVRSGLLILLVILVAMVGIGIALQMLKPEAYKNQLATAFENATGHSIAFDGELQPTFFPVPGLKTGRIRIMADPIFGPEPLLQVEHTTLQLDIAPLLRGQVVISELRFANTKASFIQTAQGERNWQEEERKEAVLEMRREEGVQALAPVTPKPQEIAAAKEEAAKKGKAGATPPLNLRIKRLLLTNSTLTYANRGNNSQYRAEMDTISLENLGAGQTAKATLAGYVENARTGAGAELSMQAEAAYALGAPVNIAITQLAMQAGKGLASGAASPGIGLTATAEVQFDPMARTLHLKSLAGALGGAPFAAEGLLLLPEHPELPEGTKFSVQTALRIESLNLDALRLAFTPPLHQQLEETFPATSPKGPDPLPKRGKKIIEAPVEPVLPPMAGHAVVAVGSLVAGGLTYSNINGVLEINPEKATLAPFSFQLAEGSVEGNLTLEGTAQSPLWGLAGSFQGLRLQTLLAQHQGPPPVEGKLHGMAELTATGTHQEALLQTLEGKATVSLQGATVQAGSLLPAELVRMGALPGSIPLAKAAADMTLHKGVASTKNIEVRSAAGSVTGAGSLNLPAKTLAMQLEILLLQGTLRVPLSLSGPWAAPNVRLNDTTGLGKLINDVGGSAKAQKVLNKLPKEAGRLLEGLGRKR